MKARSTRTDADASVHRLHRWTGLGWWRRKAFVNHSPAWRTVSQSVPGGRLLQVCDGDPKCIVTRQVTSMTHSVITDSAFALANRC